MLLISYFKHLISTIRRGKPNIFSDISIMLQKKKKEKYWEIMLKTTGITHSSSSFNETSTVDGPRLWP